MLAVLAVAVGRSKWLAVLVAQMVELDKTFQMPQEPNMVVEVKVQLRANLATEQAHYMQVAAVAAAVKLTLAALAVLVAVLVAAQQAHGAAQLLPIMAAVVVVPQLVLLDKAIMAAVAGLASSLSATIDNGEVGHRHAIRNS